MLIEIDSGYPYYEKTKTSFSKAFEKYAIDKSDSDDQISRLENDIENIKDALVKLANILVETGKLSEVEVLDLLAHNEDGHEILLDGVSLEEIRKKR